VMDFRKVLPWVLSLGFHAGILIIPLGLLMAPTPADRGVIGVDIALVGARGAGSAGRGGASFPADALAAGDSAGISGGSDAVRVPRPGTRQGGVSAATLPKVSTELPRSVLPMEDQSPVEPASVSSLPSARDILADVAALSGPVSRKTSAAGEGGSPSVDGSGPTAQATGGDTGGTGDGIGAAAGATGTRIGWEGTTRKLIRKRDPRFPDVLAAAGQEIEGEARITVAPSGTVTRVEITRGTGYSEIDAVIEAALRDYLFSRVDGKGDAVGTVRFRFRLERRD
jgi:TonB family protein